MGFSFGAWGQNTMLWDDFEGDAVLSDWSLLNGYCDNGWHWGSSPDQGANQCLYITTRIQNGSVYEPTGFYGYSTSSRATVFACRNVWLDSGNYSASYDWRCFGSMYSDFMRVVLVADSVELVAQPQHAPLVFGTDVSIITPEGWIALDGGGNLCRHADWTHLEQDFQVQHSGGYKLVVLWTNYNQYGFTGPGAIDNILLERQLCDRVTNLTCSHIASQEARLDWTDSTAQGYVVEYGLVGDTSRMRLTTTSTHCLLTGLEPSSQYVARVAVVCAEGVGPLTNVYFETECPRRQLPMALGFEEVETQDGLPPCFRRYTRLSYTYPAVEMDVALNHTPHGCRGLRWQAHPGSMIWADNTLLILPPVDTAGWMGENVQVSFWAKDLGSSSDAHWITVGVMDDAGDSATFRALGQCRIEGMGWRQYRVAVPTAVAFGDRLALRYANDAGSLDIALDDIVVERVGGCLPPYDLRTEAAGSAIAVRWRPGGEEWSWVVRCADTAITAADTFCLITNMMPGVDYRISVSAVCGADSSVPVFTTGRTECGQLPHSCLPYVEGFEEWSGRTGYTNATYVPGSPCWTIYSPQSGSAANPSAEPGAVHSGERALHYNEERSYMPGYVYLILPTFADELSTLKMKFWMNFNSLGNLSNLEDGYLRIGVWDGNMFYDMDTCSTLNWNRWLQYECDFSNYSGPEGAIAFALPKGSNGWLDLDDVVVFSALGCQPPKEAHAWSTAADTLLVAWEEDPTMAGAEYWIRYSTAESVRDTVVSGSMATLTGVAGNSDYYVSIRTIWAGDTSVECGVHVRTVCDYPELPYSPDLTGNGSNRTFDLPCWYSGRSQYTSSYPSIRHSWSDDFWYIGLEGTFPYEMTWAVLPMFDSPVQDLRLSLDVYANYTNSTLTVGVMDDPADIATFTQVAECTPANSTMWNTENIYFSSYAGSGRHIALLCRSRSYDNYSVGVQIKNIVVDVANPCRPVSNLSVSQAGVSAMATWQHSEDQEPLYYRVEYRMADGSWTAEETPYNYLPITGLTLDTNYELRVAAVCDCGWSDWQSTTFVTPPCLQGGSADLGLGTTANSHLPVNTMWGSTLCQSIYLASELHDAGLIAGNIVGMAYKWASASRMNKDFIIMLGHTDLDEMRYDSVFGFYVWTVDTLVPLSQQRVVYNGQHPMGAVGTVFYDIDTSFVWDGVRNIVVTTMMNTPIDERQSSAGFSGFATEGETFRTRYATRDAQPFDTLSIRLSATNLAFARPDVVFSGTCRENADCMPPVAEVLQTSATTATLVWAPGLDETQWRIEHRGQGAWIFDTLTGEESYVVRGLTPSTEYEFRISSLCDEADTGTVVVGTTQCVTINTLPFTENFDSCGTGQYDVLPMCWDNGPNRYPTVWTGGYVMCHTPTYGEGYRLVLPEVDTAALDLRQLEVAFDIWCDPSNYYYSHGRVAVGVMTDPEDWTTFVGVDTVTSDVATHRFACSLAGYRGTGTYPTIAFIEKKAYIDNLVLDYAPTCPQADQLLATNATPSSVRLQWRERGAATLWQVEYGAEGFALGTGTRVTATTNPFVLTGLPSTYRGQFYVRPICGAGDTGRFSSEPCGFETRQVPAQIPYAYDFESPTEWQNWQHTGSGNTTRWCRGGAMALQGLCGAYLSSNGGTTAATGLHEGNFATWRELDFGNTEADYEISFSYWSHGFAGGNDGLYVYLVDTSVSVRSLMAQNPSTWQQTEGCRRLAFMNFDTSRAVYHCALNSFLGAHSLVFVWHSAYRWYDDMAAIDDIHVTRVMCHRPTGLEASQTYGSSATLRWNQSDADSYLVSYRRAGYESDEVTTLRCDTNSVTITDLLPQTNYVAWVQGICPDGETSVRSQGCQFATFCCDTPMVVYSFDTLWPQGTSVTAPMGNSTFGFSYVQTLVPARLLAPLQGPITAMAFYTENGLGGDGYTQMRVSMANVADSSLAEGFVLERSPIALTPVVDGTEIQYAQSGWYTLYFDQPFVWDGVSNVLVAVSRRHAASQQQGVFRSHTAPVPLTRYSNQVRYYAEPASPTDGFTTTHGGDLAFYSCPSTGSCEQPFILSAVGSNSTASFSWQGEDDGHYEVNIRPRTERDWTEDNITVRGTNYTFAGLLTDVDYLLRVRKVCEGQSEVSAWSYCGVRTSESYCQPPQSMDISVISGSKALFDWQRGGDASEWELNITSDGGFDRTYTVTDLPFVADGLWVGLEYVARVRAVCSGGMLGEWGLLFPFSTDVCPNVEGLEVAAVGPTHVELRWQNDSLALGWEVEYGFEGFNVGQGTMVHCASPHVVIDSLSDEMPYSFFVRALCSDDRVSLQWAEVQVVTSSLRADTPRGVACAVFPNPALTSAKVSLHGVQGRADIALYAIDGRVMKTQRIESGEDTSCTIDLSDLPRGTYFVRVVGQNVSLVRKLEVVR